MTSEELKHLLQKLLEGSKNGKLKWIPGKEGVFQLNFPKSSIVLVDNRRESGLSMDPEFYLRIFNSKGLEVEGLSDTDFSKIGINGRAALSLLVAEIRNQVFGVRDTISDIFDNLK